MNQRRCEGRRILRAAFKIFSIHTWRRAATAKTAKPRKLLRSMLYWLKEFKSKGRYKPLRFAKKTKTSIFFNASFKRFTSSAGYIITEETYFLLN